MATLTLVTLCPAPRPLPGRNTQDSTHTPMPVWVTCPCPVTAHHKPTPGGWRSQAGPGLPALHHHTPAQPHRPPQQPTHGPAAPVAHHITCKHCSPPSAPAVCPQPLSWAWLDWGRGAESSRRGGGPSWRVTPCGIFKLFPHLLNEAFALALFRSGCSFHGGGRGSGGLTDA